jgi:hypothetical protein
MFNKQAQGFRVGQKQWQAEAVRNIRPTRILIEN